MKDITTTPDGSVVQFNPDTRMLTVEGPLAQKLVEFAQADGRTPEQIVIEALQDEVTPVDLAAIEALEGSFHETVRELDWVRGVSTSSRAAGIAIIDGKLTHVRLRKGSEMESEVVSVGTAARVMRELLTSEIELALDVESTDDGMRMFLQLVECEA